MIWTLVSHGAVHVPTAGFNTAAGCSTPLSDSDCQTMRAPTPPYQPIRSASTRHSGAAVDTRRSKVAPRLTLVVVA